MAGPEAHIQFEILKAWGAHPSLRVWRQNTGAARVRDADGVERMVRFGLPGTPDILGLVLPHGRMLGIEVKSTKGQQSEDQKRFQRMMDAFGGLYILARSVADVDAALAAVGVTR